MVKKAEGTAQKHVLLVRGEIEKLLPNPMDTISPVVPKTAKQWKELSQVPRQAHGWRYSNKAGQLCVQFENPILWDDVQQAFYDGLVKGGATDSAFIAKWDKKRAADKAAEGDAIGENTTGHKKGDVIVGTTRLLTKTSKMGCYSWNLPAGPPSLGGCCPGSNMGFYIEGMKRHDPLIGVRMLNAIRRSKNRAMMEYVKAVPMRKQDVAKRFICNGCYAMKGAYGNPSVITIMQWRYRWLRGFAIPSGQFVDTMMTAITMARLHSIKERKRLGNNPRKLAAIPHPDYFRIHDSGDMWSPEYFDMWMEVCRKMPDIHFWAPSRVWTSAKMAGDLERMIVNKKLPSNLALRPSGLFFDGPDPHIPGMAGGTSSNSITFEVKRGKIKLDIEATGPKTWGCPAYLPQQIGGGAFPKLPQPPKENPCGCAGRRNNPAQQAYAMYPPVDDATPDPKGDVFEDALFDKKKKRFLIDPSNGRPLRANAANKKKYPKAIVMKAQAFQAAGSCSVARDPNHADECRVCWGTTADKKSLAMKRLPVVYGKH